jgi:murein DD-endopeptidase MepM/ murein hydrolase activator NlpD
MNNLTPTIREVVKHAELFQSAAEEAYKHFNNMMYAITQLGKKAGISGDEPKTTTGWAWPMVGRISAPFGERRVNSKGVPYYHTGIDIADNPRNATPIYAASSGKVIPVNSDPFGYGNYLMIDHGQGLHTLYAHCSRIVVSTDQQVTAGQQVAVVGSTGHSTGPHLHFEVRLNGKPVDPMKYLPER